MAARLIEQGSASISQFRTALKECLVYGVKYTFPVERKGAIRGIPTGYAAPPLYKLIIQSPEPPPVWPYGQGHDARHLVFATTSERARGR